MDQKHPSFPNLEWSENANLETIYVSMRVAKAAIIQKKDRFNPLLEFWGCTKSPRYHVYSFHTYRTRHCRTCKDVNSRVRPTQFINGR